MSSTLLVPLIYLDFELRRDYIAQVLCIKKDEPITVCGGRCFLTRQLNRVDNQQHQDKSRVPHAEHLTFFNESAVVVSILQPFIYLKKSFLQHEEILLPNAVLTDVFHPPRLV